MGQITATVKRLADRRCYLRADDCLGWSFRMEKKTSKSNHERLWVNWGKMREDAYLVLVEDMESRLQAKMGNSFFPSMIGQKVNRGWWHSHFGAFFGYVSLYLFFFTSTSSQQDGATLRISVFSPKGRYIGPRQSTSLARVC